MNLNAQTLHSIHNTLIQYSKVYLITNWFSEQLFWKEIEKLNTKTKSVGVSAAEKEI